MDDKTALYAGYDEILQLPPMQYRVERLLERHAVLVLGGLPKEGKSRLALNMLWQAVCGQKILGRFTLGDAPLRRALIYNAEGGRIGLQSRRSMAECVPAHLHNRIIGSDDRPLLMTMQGMLGTQEWKRIEHYVKEWPTLAGADGQPHGQPPIDLILFDPLISFHATDENNNAAMEQIFQRMERLAVECDVAIIVVHHMRKPPQKDDGPVSGVQLRGASAIHGAATNIMTCTPLRKAKAADGETLLRGFRLGFELKHSEPPEDLEVITDRVSGRFYPRLGTNGPYLADPEAFVVDWGQDVKRYARAFACPEKMAAEVLGVETKLTLVAAKQS